MMTTVTEIVGMLTAASVDARDTDVTPTPTGPYVVVSDRDAGLSQAHRASLTPHWTRTTVDVRLVARTIPGLRRLIAATKGALSGRRLPSGPVLRELEVSPLMTTGTAGDRRHEAVIAYRTQTLTGATP